MKGLFQRVSPAKFAESVGIPAGWFVISHRYMPERLSRRFAHGRWYKISSAEGSIYRILRFSPNLVGSPGPNNEGQIVLDWPGWLDLHGRAENVDAPLNLTYSEVKWWSYPKMAIVHPDPTVRLAGELGLLSSALGVLSVALAIIALW